MTSPTDPTDALIQDVIELRERQWVPRNTIATLTTISGTQPKAGGPLQFGTIDAVALSSSKKGDPEDSGPSMFQVLAPQRRKLKLQPRTKSIGETSQAIKPAASEIGYDEEPAGVGMSEADAKAKIDQDVRAFFSIRVLDEAESYFSSLPTEHRHLLVEILVAKSIAMKEPDVRLVGDLFARVREKGLCNPRIFEEGFSRLAEILSDLARDIPVAWPYFAILLRGSGLDQDKERRTRIGEKTMNNDQLNRLLLDAGLLAPHV
jgi:MA3 domain